MLGSLSANVPPKVLAPAAWFARIVQRPCCWSGRQRDGSRSRGNDRHLVRLVCNHARIPSVRVGNLIRCLTSPTPWHLVPAGAPLTVAKPWSKHCWMANVNQTSGSGELRIPSTRLHPVGTAWASPSVRVWAVIAVAKQRPSQVQKRAHGAAACRKPIDKT